ncbi:siderophore-iron reductase FhuF [Halomonas elongata]|uniref:siderophore-iron reductase FhuF n=1 Tax=Halomonas elongata TaxID=2746 RepID=UPI00255B08A6|nr:siderophore-iron reductase FhuF [Halomonas elongata]MDL4864018.1 siderophore-iron reductase FhuF [Halomonas elongata]
MSFALSSLYIGPMEQLTPPRVSTRATPDTIAAAELLDPARLEALMAGFSARYPGGDRRALVSLWTKWHFATLAATTLAANLILERDLPLGLDDLRLILAPEGHVAGLCLKNEGHPLAELDGTARFTTLIDDHLTPLIEGLAAYSGASPKVFWSNAGNYFEYFVSALPTHPMASEAMTEPAQRLMASRTLADGRRNPLYQPVRYVDTDHVETDHVDANDEAAPRRVRRLCCIRYLIDELGYCGNCPLECRRRPVEAT